VTQPTNRSPLYFEAQTKKQSRWFWDQNHQTVTTGFEAQTGKPEVTSFEAKPGETIATGFEAMRMAITKFQTHDGTNQNTMFLNGKDHTPWNQGK
jgi:hypothetical protein